MHKAREVINRLSNPESFFTEGSTLSERAQLGMAHNEHGTGAHGGQDDLTEALVALRPSRDATVCLRQSMAWR